MADNDTRTEPTLTEVLSRMLREARDDRWGDNRCTLAAGALETRVQVGDFAAPSRPPVADNDQTALIEIIGRALFGTTDGGLVEDESELPVGELWRLLREVAIPRAVAAGWRKTEGA